MLIERYMHQLGPWIEGRQPIMVSSLCKLVSLKNRWLLHLCYILYRFINRRNDGRKFLYILSGRASLSTHSSTILKLAVDIMKLVNAEADSIRAVFLPNHGVTLSEKLAPAIDISQHLACSGVLVSSSPANTL